jgi:hypothetical protein
MGVGVFVTVHLFSSRFVPTMIGGKIPFPLLFLSESQSIMDGDGNTHTHAWM